MELLLFAISLNLFAGLFLSIKYALQSSVQIPSKLLLWLFLFPSVGWGKVKFHLEKHSQTRLPYPEKWFIYEYMIKLHKRYLLIQCAMPFVFLIVAWLTTVYELAANPNSPDIISNLFYGFGIAALFMFIVFFGIFWIGIQYIILVVIPRSSQRSIEKKIILAQNFDHSRTKLQPKPRVMTELFPSISEYCKDRKTAFKTIDKSRKKTLAKIAQYVTQKLQKNELVNLVFVCTHNSRRSQFGQVWAAVAAANYGIGNVKTFSAGTEETAFNKRAVEAIKRAGFKVESSVGTNPRYSVQFSEEAGALDCYSKTISHRANPTKNFASIMTCSDADENCPMIIGSEYREAVTYEDPKVADRTANETYVYDERCQQIATEMLYLFSLVHQ